MTNHKQVAIDWVDYSSNLNPDVDNKASHAAQLAQVHATLALAEQQRATNLLLATALSHGWGQADITAPWTSVNDTARWEAVRAEIAAALGITEES